MSASSEVVVQVEHWNNCKVDYELNVELGMFSIMQDGEQVEDDSEKAVLDAVSRF